MKAGDKVMLTGDISSLNYTGARQPRLLENMLGYKEGRLAQGYWMCLLLDVVQVADFRLGGLTSSSGGREGLPAKTWEAEAQRRRIDDRVTAEYDEGGKALREIARNAINRVLGPQRTVKIVPVTRHDKNMAPDEQYPPGEGAPQWTLLDNAPKTFLVAGMVDPAGRFTGPDFTADLGPTARYDDRAKVARYLETARG